MVSFIDRFVIAAFVVAVTFSVPVTRALAADDDASGKMHAHSVTDVWAMARGGQLYDNWMAVVEADPPKQTHPAYPATGKKKGATTWRCKECHGWDYKGVDGAYAKGSHFTGIKGVRGVAGMDPEKLHSIIMNKTHGFTEQMLPHSAMEKLALFLTAVSSIQTATSSVRTKRHVATRGTARPYSRRYAPSVTVLTEPRLTSSRSRRRNMSAPCASPTPGKRCTRSALGNPGSGWWR